ncbi:MAG: glycosyltransferase family 2 protein [Parerythrobacter sp.]
MSFPQNIEATFDLEPECSFVIPFFDERESLHMLYSEIVEQCEAMGKRFELIFVDDGSKDKGSEIVRELAKADSRVSFLRFRRNFGKSAALSAGFTAARGDVVFSMDADLQDNPSELGKFFKAIEAGADVVSGWKQVRNDPVDKTLPSKLFNGAVNRVFGLKLNDHNCGFKAYRCETLAELNLYGELHRFVPALLHARGFQVAEIAVQHRPRRFGESKFGSKRLVKGALDLLTVWLTTRYGARPLHFFGGAGFVALLLGGAIIGYLSCLWALGFGPIGDRPLLLFGMLLVLGGGQLIGVGLLGELLLAGTINENDKYAIAECGGAIARGQIDQEIRAVEDHSSVKHAF